MMNMRATSLETERERERERERESVCVCVCCRDILDHLGEFKVSDMTLLVEEAENADCRPLVGDVLQCTVLYTQVAACPLVGLSHLHRPDLWPKR